VRRAPARRPPSEAERRRSFLVLPFRNVSRADEHDWLVEGSPIMIADALSQRDELTVVPDERLYPALQRAGLRPGEVMDLARVRRIAGETGGWTAVTGDVLAIQGRIRISARAFDVVSNAEVVRAVEEAAPGEDVRAVFQRLGTRLIRAAGIDTAAADLAATTTGSLDAYRAYVRGIAHYNRSEARRARDAFLEAVRLDTTFAQAYAKLAEASLSANPMDLATAGSQSLRYAARAAALADRLPARDRELVLGINDLLSGRFRAARERLVRLSEQDSTDVDALEWRMTVEAFHPILAPAGGAERPVSSLNRALALAKRILELDPARHHIYQNLVQIYLLAAGGPPGFLPAWREEAPSLPALVNSPPARTFVPLLFDSLVLVPSESLSISADTLAAARARALAAARAWVSRWLDVGRTEAEAHLWASRVADLAGDYQAALRELETADSLGVETGLENVPARRMALLAKLRRYNDGARIADSLFQAGALNMAALNAFQIEGAGWAYTLFLLGGLYGRADTLLERTILALAPAAAANPELTGDMLGVLILGGYVTQFFKLPPDVRAAVLEQLLREAARLPPGRPVARLLPFSVMLALRDTTTPSRPEIAAHGLAAAAALHDGGHTDAAFELATAIRSDSAQRRAAESLSWYAARRRAARQLQIETQRRFRPVGASVSDSAAVFTWAVTGETFVWYRTETAIRESDFNWTVEFEVAGRHYEVIANVDRRPGSRSADGSLSELLNTSLKGLHEIVSSDTNVAHRPVRSAVVRLEIEPAGFRMVLREREVLAALRRERPYTARFRFRPCVHEPDDAAVRCVDERVRVAYP
jgi:TolB-like protein